MPVESIKVPDLGDTKDVEVIELLVSVGQTIKENDSLLVLESDKAAMEIPSPRSGVVKSISLKIGDQVSEGQEILKLEVEVSAASPDKAPEKKPAEKTPEKDADKAPAKKMDNTSTGAQSANKSAEKSATSSNDSSKSSASASDSVEIIKVPDLGGDSDVEVIEIHVKAGAEIAAEDPLITLESDKAAMEIPAPAGGRVKTVKVKVGDKVSAGSVILELQISGAGNVAAGSPKATASSSAPASSAAQEKASTVAEGRTGVPSTRSAQAKQDDVREPNAQPGSTKVYAGPAVRKLARELGVDLTQVAGSGAKARIQKEDIHTFVQQRLRAPVVAAVGSGASLPSLPDIDFSQFGDIEQVAMSKLHKLTASNMHRSWNLVPHVFQFNEADITELEEFRVAQKTIADKKGVKLTLLPFLLKACAKVLQEYKQFNVSLHSSGEYLIQKKYIHIGVAVATEAGLMVPVIRNVDRKSIWELAEELGQITDKAKQRRLSKEDMQGACFTISSLGAIGGTGFTPIVNTPEVGILGVSKTQVKPVFINGEFVPRQMLPVTLSYDHRAVNGVDAGQFATLLVQLLADIRLLLL